MADQDRIYLDKQEGLERIRGNVKVYKTVLNSFASKNLLEEMQENLAAGQNIQASHTVHAIKGTAGNLSMPALYEAATELEQTLKHAKQSQQEVDAFAEIYEKTLEAVNGVLEEL